MISDAATGSLAGIACTHAVIELDREVAWREVEDARAKSGIMGASFDGKNILVYNTEDTPQVFAEKVKTLIGSINDAG